MKALVKNELRLTRKLLLIWMGIVLILCGFAYFEYLSLKESLNELTGLINPRKTSLLYADKIVK